MGSPLAVRKNRRLRRTLLPPIAGAAVAILFGSGCGGGMDETVATTPESAAAHQIWSAARPRLEMEVERDGVWAARLPLGEDAARGPAVRLAADSLGVPAEERVWIGEVGEGREVPIAPYPDQPGYFNVEPVAVEFSGADGSARRTVIDPLVRAKGDGVLEFRYSAAEVRRGVFPAVGREFLLCDADANGLYEWADLLVIDQNGDGLFDGNRNSVERYSLDEPFLLGAHAYRIASVEPDGSAVRWVDSDVRPEPRVPLLTGDAAPDFELNDLRGAPVRFSEARRGRPVLLSYWASW